MGHATNPQFLKKLFLSFVVIALFASLSTASDTSLSPKQKAEKLVKQADDFIKTEAFSKAQLALKKAVALQKDYPEIYRAYGDLFRKQKKWTEAAQYYNKWNSLKKGYFARLIGHISLTMQRYIGQYVPVVRSKDMYIAYWIGLFGLIAYGVTALLYVLLDSGNSGYTEIRDKPLFRLGNFFSSNLIIYFLILVIIGLVFMYDVENNYEFIVYLFTIIIFSTLFIIRLMQSFQSRQFKKKEYSAPSISITENSDHAHSGKLKKQLGNKPISRNSNIQISQKKDALQFQQTKQKQNNYEEQSRAASPNKVVHPAAKHTSILKK